MIAAGLLAAGAAACAPSQGDASRTGPSEPLTSTTRAIPSTSTTSSSPIPTSTTPAPVSSTPNVPVPPGSTVVVVGDSISARSADQIKAAFAGAGVKATVIASEGFTLQDSTANIAKAAASGPTAIVFALGTNDVASIVKGEAGYSPATFDQGLGTAIAKFPKSCVVVTTVNANYTAAAKGTGTTEVNRVAVQVNGILRAASAHVADWDKVVRTDPSLLIQDQTHPTDAGEVALANAMVGAVRTC